MFLTQQQIKSLYKTNGLCIISDAQQVWKLLLYCGNFMVL